MHSLKNFAEANEKLLVRKKCFCFCARECSTFYFPQLYASASHFIIGISLLNNSWLFSDFRDFKTS